MGIHDANDQADEWHSVRSGSDALSFDTERHRESIDDDISTSSGIRSTQTLIHQAKINMFRPTRPWQSYAQRALAEELRQTLAKMDRRGQSIIQQPKRQNRSTPSQAKIPTKEDCCLRSSRNQPLSHHGRQHNTTGLAKRHPLTV